MAKKKRKKNATRGPRKPSGPKKKKSNKKNTSEVSRSTESMKPLRVTFDDICVHYEFNNFKFNRKLLYFMLKRAIICDIDNINSMTSNGMSIITVSEIIEDKKFVKLLLANKLDINVQDKKGTSALMYASTMTDLDRIKFMIAKGANINQKDTTGCTALYYSLVSKTDDILEYLLKSGSNPRDSDNYAIYPYDITKMFDLNSKSQLLLNHGAQKTGPQCLCCIKKRNHVIQILQFIEKTSPEHVK